MTIIENWNLPCRLTEEELAQRSFRQQKAIAEKVTKEAEIDLAKKKAKKEIDKLDEEILSLNDICLSKSEKRMVEVEKVMHFHHKRVEFVRLDTGEIVDSRQMTEKELQEDLPFEGGKKKKKEIEA